MTYVSNICGEQEIVLQRTRKQFYGEKRIQYYKETGNSITEKTGYSITKKQETVLWRKQETVSWGYPLEPEKHEKQGRRR